MNVELCGVFSEEYSQGGAIVCDWMDQLECMQKVDLAWVDGKPPSCYCRLGVLKGGRER